MLFLGTILNRFHELSIFPKNSSVGVWLGSECTSTMEYSAKSVNNERIKTALIEVILLSWYFTLDNLSNMLYCLNFNCKQASASWTLCRGVNRPLSNIYDEDFAKIFSKTSIIDVWRGHKYASNILINKNT